MSAKDDTEAVLGLALLAGGIWLAYKIYQGLGVAGTAIVNAQQAAGSAVADLIPTHIAQPGETFSVTMPDGTVEQVPYGQQPVPSSQYVAPFDPSQDADFSNAGNF